MKLFRKHCVLALLLFVWAIACCSLLEAQSRKTPPAATQAARPAAAPAAAIKIAPALESGDLDTSRSEMRPLIDRYVADRSSLSRMFAEGGAGGAGGGGRGAGGPGGGGAGGEGASSRNSLLEAWPARREQTRQFYANWVKRLDTLEFESLSQDGRVDYLLFRNLLTHELRDLELRAKDFDEAAPLFPFAATIMGLEESRRKVLPIDAARAAGVVTTLAKDIDRAQKTAEAALKTDPKASPEEAAHRKTIASKAGGTVSALRNVLRTWFNFYNGYDPMFTWWLSEPYKAADKSLQGYASFLTERVAGERPNDPAGRVVNPIGREALLSDLAYEMIPYTPEELVEIANREFAWCESEMKKASRQMGFGEDWKKALEKVKTLHVEPGEQPRLIQDLALEAEEFLRKRDLITIPELVSWRMDMMTPERQLVNPFFTGGDAISVSYPTSSMTQEQKEMSMRGNNIHFSRATVFHELVPGHNLQGFMAARYRTYRSPFNTSFFGEGWALYWEMLMWDLDFARSPEDRVGMLFWRMHRCARIIFSLSFHLGKMTPQQAVDFLVDRVGHERDNATAEVRRSFDGSYAPLYQAAYMLGGLQLRALRRELVDSGKMTNRAFHDAVLKENRIPVEMIRASLTGQKLDRDFASNWRFYGLSAAPAAK